MVFLFNKTIENILSDYIPHETVTCNDKDLPWINRNIKQQIQEKNDTYRSYISNDKNSQKFNKVKYVQNQLKNLIECSQGKYYLRISKKLINSMAGPKTYWSILKTFLNNKKFLTFLLYFKTANM